MGAFDEVVLPKKISYGSTGGPGYSTGILAGPGGQEQRVERYSAARHGYDLATGVKNAADLALLRDFYHARRGAARGFRFSDPMDFSSGANHIGAAARTDQLLGIGDGVIRIFQLVKRYTSGDQSYVRKIVKPVDGSVLAAIAGSPASATVDYTTGLVTYASAPLLGQEARAGFLFDVPVRFDESADKMFRVNMADFRQGSLSSLPVLELMDDEAVPDDMPMGGSTEIVVSGDFTISAFMGRFVVVQTLAPGLSGGLPETTALPDGDLYWRIANYNSPAFTIKTAGGAPVVEIGTNEIAEVFLSLGPDGVTKSWFAA